MSADEPAPFTRPFLSRTGPDRRAMNYYRSAASDGKGKDGTALGGIPLASAEAAVVAAVRMAYKVADAQIDRSARLARRLREAGDQAIGRDSDKRALDAAERLVSKAFMALLGWVETAAVEDGSPLKRLMVAQYRLFGALLGITDPGEHGAPPSPAPPRPDTAQGPPTAEPPRSASLRVQHTGQERRAVEIRACSYAGDIAAGTTIPVTFYAVEGQPRQPVGADVVVDGPRSLTLRLDTAGFSGGNLSTPGSRWRSALCDADGLQIGQIEIVL
jgi:hypothetical protein